MSYRSRAIAVAAFASMHVASAKAQSVYVAPGGAYYGRGRCIDRYSAGRYGQSCY
jgi:hypothetical protein